jgi:hypothetical protein
MTVLAAKIDELNASIKALSTTGFTALSSDNLRTINKVYNDPDFQAVGEYVIDDLLNNRSNDVVLAAKKLELDRLLNMYTSLQQLLGNQSLVLANLVALNAVQEKISQHTDYLEALQHSVRLILSGNGVAAKQLVIDLGYYFDNISDYAPSRMVIDVIGHLSTNLVPNLTSSTMNLCFDFFQTGGAGAPYFNGAAVGLVAAVEFVGIGQGGSAVGNIHCKFSLTSAVWDAMIAAGMQELYVYYQDNVNGTVNHEMVIESVSLNISPNET